jgi:hypothetical protein
MESEIASGTQGGTARSGGVGMSSGRPVLRSYLPSPQSDTSGVGDAIGSTGRSSVDEAGVRRVMQYELEAERTPREMPHNNPGYDVESRDGSGQIVRYIEVKSFSGRWEDTFADLSRTQFETANNLGELFWLYVVERAESDDYEIYRIQNPVLKANHFMFDDGWRSLAEPSGPSEKGIMAHVAS